MSDPISSVVSLVKTGIDKIFPDAGEKEKAQLQQFLETLNGQIKIIVTEMSGNWLQRSWRPILMLAITAILVNNYILVPYLALFGVPATVLEFPDKLWNLLTLGVSGYIASRGTEKVVETLKAAKNK